MTARRDWRHDAVDLGWPRAEIDHIADLIRHLGKSLGRPLFGCTKLVEMPPYGHMIVMQTDGARYEFYRRTGAAAPPRQPAMALTPTTR